MKGFYDLKYDEEKDIVFLIWNKESKNLKDEEFLQVQDIYTEYIIEKKAKNTIVDIRNLNFAVRPSLQEKIAKKYYPKTIKAGLSKVAVINSNELIAQISAEQMMEEAEAAPFQTKFFDEVKSAIQWLIKS